MMNSHEPLERQPLWEGHTTDDHYSHQQQAMTDSYSDMNSSHLASYESLYNTIENTPNSSAIENSYQVEGDDALKTKIDGRHIVMKALSVVARNIKPLLLAIVYIAFVCIFVVHPDDKRSPQNYALTKGNQLAIDMRRDEPQAILRTWFALSSTYYLYNQSQVDEADWIQPETEYYNANKKNSTVVFKFQYYSNETRSWLAAPNQTYTYILPNIVEEDPPPREPEKWKAEYGAVWFDFRTVGKYYRERGITRPLEKAKLRILITTNSHFPVPFSLDVTQCNRLIDYEVLFAAIILVAVYLLIIFDIVHRTIAAMVGAMAAVSVLTLLRQRPSFEEVAHWIKFETVGLLFGMMIMVGVYSKTGFFEFMAIKAYKISKGKVWRLTFILCLLAAIVSAFLDNVTTILLMIPVTIRLCKVVNISPVPIMISIVMFSNIGGGSTAVGDLVLIVNHPEIQARGITFFNLSLFIAPASIMNIIAVFALVRFILYRKVFQQKPILNDERMAKEKEIEIWKSSLRRIGDSSPEEKEVRQMLMKHVSELEADLNILTQQNQTGLPAVDVEHLEKQYQIHDMRLFIICTSVLVVVIAMFFCEPFIRSHLDLSLPWIAVIGATTILLLSGINKDMTEVVEKVEWVTLLFFGSLFILMKGLEELGLIEYVGSVTITIIQRINERFRLTVAITVITWASAFVSAFIDNVACISAFIPVIIQLADGAGMPIAPLVWAVAFGVTLGGNGTLIGASGNLIASGIADQERVPISFFSFLKAGFPTMLLTITIANIYLIVIHVWWKLGLSIGT